jgi:prolipoprotein diacylglyceryltransferase
VGAVVLAALAMACDDGPHEAALLVRLIRVVGRREPGWRGSPGRAASAMVLGYAALRFATEFLRADNRLVLSVLTMPQMMCLLVAAGIGVASMRGGLQTGRALRGRA